MNTTFTKTSKLEDRTLAIMRASVIMAEWHTDPGFFMEDPNEYLLIDYIKDLRIARLYGVYSTGRSRTYYYDESIRTRFLWSVSTIQSEMEKILEEKFHKKITTTYEGNGSVFFKVEKI